MYKRLNSFFEKNKIFYSGLFGFRANHSTNHATLLITNKIQRQLKKRCIHVEYSLTLVKHLILLIIKF